MFKSSWINRPISASRGICGRFLTFGLIFGRVSGERDGVSPPR